jgi:hypothetical protein
MLKKKKMQDVLRRKRVVMRYESRSWSVSRRM